MQLTKKDLVNQLSQATTLTKKQVELVLESLGQTVKENMDKVIVLPGIGRLKTVTRAARQGVNPATKEKIQIPAKQAVSFKPAKELLDSLN